MMYKLARPLIFALDAETAHDLTLSGLKILPAGKTAHSSKRLASHVAGIHFPNPVGLAPGFDKNARIASRLFHYGFGFVEVGTITPLAQSGNPRPRLFRLKEDRAVINRFGFNNDGADVAAANITVMREDGLAGPLGINIGANKEAADRIQDYASGVTRFAALADYLTVNISSPNTPGLRALQDESALDELLSAVMEGRQAASAQPPVFLKVAPDLLPADVDAIVRLADKHALDALIVSNTTIERPALQSAHAQETGGLSGAPLRDMALQRLKDFRAASGGTIPLIGVGGISTAQDAYDRICAGASLVQIYSAMVYEGPKLAAHINKGLEKLLARDGFDNIQQAIGCAGKP